MFHQIELIQPDSVEKQTDALSLSDKCLMISIVQELALQNLNRWRRVSLWCQLGRQITSIPRVCKGVCWSKNPTFQQLVCGVCLILAAFVQIILGKLLHGNTRQHKLGLSAELCFWLIHITDVIKESFAIWQPRMQPRGLPFHIWGFTTFSKLIHLLTLLFSLN